jgi:hypothetical protein
MSAPRRNLWRTLIARPQYSRPKLAELTTEYAGGLLTFVDNTLEKIKPKWVPKLVDASFKRALDDEYTDRSYHVFHLGDGESKLPAQSGTISVPLRGDLYMRAMEVMRDTAKTMLDQGRAVQSGPISIRFVKGGTALLGEPEDCCKFECIFSGDGELAQKNARAMVTAYYRALRQALGNDVRVHFGQLQPDGFDAGDLAATYPKAARFARVQAQFDPEGRMLNDWQEPLLRPAAGVTAARATELRRS